MSLTAEHRVACSLYETVGDCSDKRATRSLLIMSSVRVDHVVRMTNFQSDSFDEMMSKGPREGRREEQTEGMKSTVGDARIPNDAVSDPTAVCRL